MSTEFKNCTGCGESLPLNQFRSRGGSKSHLKKSRCNTCLYKQHKQWSEENIDKISIYREKDKWNLRKRCQRHNISVSEFMSVYNEQDCSCAICKKEISIEDSAIDHNHDSGEFRGVLCKTCNRALGMFSDNPDVLMSAFNYLLDKGYYGKFEQ